MSEINVHTYKANVTSASKHNIFAHCASIIALSSQFLKSQRNRPTERTYVNMVYEQAITIPMPMSLIMQQTAIRMAALTIGKGINGGIKGINKVKGHLQKSKTVLRKRNRSSIETPPENTTSAPANRYNGGSHRPIKRVRICDICMGPTCQCGADVCFGTRFIVGAARSDTTRSSPFASAEPTNKVTSQETEGHC